MEKRRLTWEACYPDGKTVEQYPDGGGIVYFDSLPQEELLEVRILRESCLVACLPIPEGCRAEIVYRTGIDYTLGGGQESLPVHIVTGWRSTCGDKKEAWLEVSESGAVTLGVTPLRPWRDYD